LAGKYTPPIVVSEKQGKYFILDGLQRRTAFNEAINGNNVFIHEDKNLRLECMKKLKESKVAIEIVRFENESDERELFIKLNDNKVSLNAQELRRAIFYNHPFMQAMYKGLGTKHDMASWAVDFYKIMSSNTTMEKLSIGCKDEDILLTLLAFKDFSRENPLKVSKNAYMDNYLKDSAEAIINGTVNPKYQSVEDISIVLFETVKNLSLFQELIDRSRKDINQEVMFRGLGMAMGKFSPKILSARRNEIIDILINANNLEIENTDNRNVQYWNAILTYIEQKLSEIDISRVFGRSEIEKKYKSSNGFVHTAAK
jgi:hypothetical protein